MYLPDINLWLALAFARHFHHISAKMWFDTVPDGQCSFCRMTQQGFLRLATNPKVFQEDAVSLATAWTLYDALLSDPRIGFTHEPEGLEPVWRKMTQSKTRSPKVWNDAYLAAFAQRASLSIVTFDGGLSQFEGIRCTYLT